MKLTPKQAEKVVAGAPVANRVHEAEVTAAIGSATLTGSEFLAGQVEALDAALTAVQTDAAVTVRDGLEALVKAGVTQAIGFAQYSETYSALTGQLAELERERDEIARRLESLTTVAADPAAFTEDLYRRFPALKRPDFSFE